MGECDGRVAFVTGASRGIGRAIAQRLAAEGASVVLNASRMGAHGDLEGTLEESVSRIQAAGGKAFAVAADLSDADARADLIARASEPFGPVDIVVNNAANATMAMPSQVTTAQRSAPVSSISSSRSLRRTTWSTAENGSSSSKTSGSRARARATATLCRWPPDNS